MDFLTYLAVLVATTLIQRALAPKVRNPMPALEDFQLPTAEYGRPIPWLFGTRKIKDPNIVWYGDLDRHAKTKDGAKYYTYYMGLHLEICIGPVDAVYKIWYGDKVCWEGEVTDSELIQIDQPGLYGGRYKEGGIEGSFNLLFGKPTQPVNNYLEAQIGLPLSAFRDSFTIVGRKPALVANSTYIKPLMPLVKRIRKGWPDDTCWYAEKAEVARVMQASWSYDEFAQGMHDGTPLDYWWKLNTDLTAGAEANVGAAGTAALAMSGPTTNVDVAQPTLTLNTTDALSLRRRGGYANWIGCATVLIDGTSPFSAGVWVSTTAAQQVIFKSNLGGNQGSWRGLDLYLPTPDRVQVVFGDNAGGHYRVVSPTGSIVSGQTHFIVVTCDPTAGTFAQVVAATKLYIDGAEQALTYATGSGTAVAWPVTASVPSGWNGIAYDSIDTYGEYSDRYMDEAFVHLDTLSPAVIEELWLRGSGDPQPEASGEMNPIHIIYDVWVDQHQGMAEDPASIDDAAMRYAADLCYDEGLGLSMYWARQSRIEDFVGEVCRHAGLLQTINPRTGQLKIVALRDDYDVSSLDALTEDQVIEVVEWQDAADGEAVNTITVRWVDRDGIDQATTYTNRASVQQHGVIAETRDYPGIAWEDLARRIAKRDAKESSSNLAKGKIKVNRIGWDKYPGDVFILSHAAEGIEEIVVRVLEIDGGTLTDGAITLTVVQDIFSLPLDVPEVGEQAGEWTSPTTDPADVTTAALMELPYWALLDALGVADTAALGDDAGYIAALAAKPTPLTTDIDIWARISPAAYTEVRAEQACLPSAALVAALSRADDTDIALDDLSQLEEVAADWLVQIGTGATAELCRVTAIDVDAATVSLDRAILDTTPQEHAIGAALFFLPPTASDWARDPTQYADADAIDVKLQTGTASGELAIDSATAISITMASRQARPYPPGLIEINGEAHPTRLQGAPTITWAHRDRLVQGAAIVTQSDSSDYGPEATTTYNAYAYDDDTEALLDSDTGISVATWSPVLTSSCRLRIEVESERGGYVSWQRQVRTFTFIADLARIVVSGDPRETATGTIRDTTG